MQSKRKVNTAEKQQRIVKIVSTEEVKAWKQLFALHGTKTDFDRKTGIPRITLNKVMKTRRGPLRVIKAIRKYHQQESIMA